MATTTNTTRPTGKGSVDEAVRATVEASRRTVQSMQDATRLTQDLLAHSAETSRKLFAAYTTSVTAGIEAAFNVQNAALAAGLSLLEATSSSNREMARHISETTRQSQQAMLDAWQAGIRAADRLAAGTEPD